MRMVAAVASFVAVGGSGGGSVVHRSRGRAQWGFPTPRPQPPSLRRQSPNARPTIALSARGLSIGIKVAFVKKYLSGIPILLGKNLL